MTKIKGIKAFTVFDSRGYPTIEARVLLDNGKSGSAIVPSGASTGKLEALELRDARGDYFGGKSVENAIHNIDAIITPAMVGMSVADQAAIDKRMLALDGTANKSKLGANAILAVSMACAQAAARDQDVPLFRMLSQKNHFEIPIPEIQIIGGGAHSAGSIDVQDFMIICHGASTLMEVYEMTFNIYQAAGRILQQQGRLVGVADEGGFWPRFNTNEEGLQILVQAMKNAGYKPGEDVGISLDLAAAEYHRDGKYAFNIEERLLDPSEYYEVIASWLNNYPICSVEDPFAEDDVENWKKLTDEFGEKVQIIGDDLFVTNKERLLRGVEGKWANSVLIKLNQIGSVSETLDCIDAALEHNFQPVVSARSGETEDSFIAHLAVGTHAGQFKVGSWTRSERMVKWNELLRIQEYLRDQNLEYSLSKFRWKKV